MWMSAGSLHSNVPYASVFLRGLCFTVCLSKSVLPSPFLGAEEGPHRPLALSLQYLFYPTFLISLLTYVYFFNISDQLVEVFLAATWEQMERNHMDPG